MNKQHLAKISSVLGSALLVCVMVASAGCATKSKPVETPAVAFVDSMTVPLAFDDAWQVTRDVLLAHEDVEIYTRDKRGMFVVYTDMHRQKLIVPHRSMLTITLEKDTKESTKISVETVAQRYGVTPLTYPGWKDKDTVSEEEIGREILESIKTRVPTN